MTTPQNLSRRNLIASSAAVATGTLAMSVHGSAASASSSGSRNTRMNSDTLTMKDGTRIYFKDWGSGPVVTFSHGWPLNADAWDGCTSWHATAFASSHTTAEAMAARRNRRRATT